jgi:hypothetical protein
VVAGVAGVVWAAAAKLRAARARVKKGFFMTFFGDEVVKE